MPLRIEQSTTGFTVRLSGDAGIAIACELKAALLDALASSTEITIDAAGVIALDITTLQLLWAVHHAASKAGTPLTLVKPVTEPVRQAMILAGMEGFTVFTQ